MAIAEMRKLNLVALSYEKDAILDALQRTGAVEVTLHEDTENTVVPAFRGDELHAYYAQVEAALFSLCTEVEIYEKANGIKSDVLKDGFDVSYEEFITANEKRAEIDNVVHIVNGLVDEKNTLKNELAKTEKQRLAATVYACLKTPFNQFSDTAHTKIRLGVLSVQSLEKVQEVLQNVALCSLTVLNTAQDNVLIAVASHKSVAAETDGVLSSFAFAECPYKDETSGEELYARLLQKEKELTAALQENAAGMYALNEKVRPLKTYCDYLAFALEKETLSEKLRETETTFFMQAYVPKDAEERVKEEITKVTAATYIAFEDPSEDETPPTLLRNNKIIENFEGITNTYSAPNYREFDPNTVMAFFYSLFMGFIIGDMGYGILMLLGGGFLWWKNRKRPTGMSRLAGAFAIGGIFAIVWGALFNSLFGFGIFSKTVMPNPQTDMWSLAGIAVPSVLIISMLIGVFQLFVGYVCRTVQEWRKGKIVDGICDGVLWAVFSVGVGLAIVGFVDQANIPILGTVGGITAGVSLVLAMLTAGRKEKFFGKFTKGFGAAYGVINYASDILSYARLYGLMLSGAVIAQIVSNYGGGFIASGNIGMIIVGVLLLVVGHLFNLVMNLLGAYIHDARLQYVEFYGRFYQGEGELFAPLGSKHKYVYVLPSMAENNA